MGGYWRRDRGRPLTPAECATVGVPPGGGCIGPGGLVLDVRTGAVKAVVTIPPSLLGELSAECRRRGGTGLMTLDDILAVKGA